MTIEKLLAHLGTILLRVRDWMTSPAFYAQVAVIAAVLVLAFLFARTLRRYLAPLSDVPAEGPLSRIRKVVVAAAALLFPLFIILGLEIADALSTALINESWLIKFAQSVAVIFMLYSIINRSIKQPLVASLCKWIAIPVATLHIFGWLDTVTRFLDAISIDLGNIHLSAYGVIRLVIFGSALFWLGRVSSNTGQEIIRRQEGLDLATREVFAKLFQVCVTFAILLLLLQVMGINLTTLAVFGGAVGVGLGFGLQAIASNFISGIIILLDRSVAVGDYVEMADGQSGTIRELDMRSTTLETFDGKDIVIPNEHFITQSFKNWTHKNHKQRYALELSVAYSTDLHALFALLREVVSSHPQVISGPEIPKEERPDAEIKGFGDSGVEILIEFWMVGVDDGRNRVGGDLLLMIWDAFKEHNIEIPFPQREVKILKPRPVGRA